MSNETRTSPIGHVAQLGRGFAMGAADIVPGVSGGTVALVLGIYERLIRNVRAGAKALKALITGNITMFRATLVTIEWVWLITLLVGILAAVATLSSILESLLTDHPQAMAGLFFGLVVGTIWVAWRLIDRFDPGVYAVIVGVAVALFLVLGLREDTEVAEDATKAVTQPVWVFFLVGAIAICAMILPGISGSFILVLLGMYTEVLGAVKERDIVSLAALALGCTVGLALFSTLLNWLLDHYHRWVVAAMIGLMLGSMRVLWPWPNGTFTTTLSAPSDPVALPIVLAVIGAAVVIAVEQFGSRLKPAE